MEEMLEFIVMMTLYLKNFESTPAAMKGMAKLRVGFANCSRVE